MIKRIFGLAAVTSLMLALFGALLVGTVAAQTTGTNWFGTFYNNTTLSGSPVATNVSYPNGLLLNWGDSAPRDGLNNPVPGVGADNFSATFTSAQSFAQLGTYTFTVYANDGVRITLNGQVLTDQFNDYPDESGTQATRVITFQYPVSTQSVSMQVDYVEFTGYANLGVQWILSGGGGQFTPVGPTPTAVPPALASVRTVRGLALRTGPYLGASLVAVARPEIAYPVLAQNFDEGLFPWYKIQVGDRIGWSSGRYLDITGNLAIVPTEDSIFDRIDNPNDLPPLLKVIGTTRAVMNLRRRPGERAQLLGKIPWGDQVEVIGRTIQGGQLFWLHVRYQGVVGWIYAPYITLDGVVDALPIR